MTTVTAGQLEAVRARLLDTAIHLPSGLGADPGNACTMAQVNFALTGRLADSAHPCVSEVVRRWVVRIQDALSDEVRNSAEWRQAAVGIAGSAGSDADEAARVALLLAWNDAYAAAARAAAYAAVAAHAAYTSAVAADAGQDDAAAARAAAYAAAAVAAHAAYTSAVAAAVTWSNPAASNAYWQRADAPGMLARLIACRAVSV